MLDGLLYDSDGDSRSFLILENGLQKPCSFVSLACPLPDF